MSTGLTGAIMDAFFMRRHQARENASMGPQNILRFIKRLFGAQNTGHNLENAAGKPTMRLRKSRSKCATAAAALTSSSSCVANGQLRSLMQLFGSPLLRRLTCIAISHSSHE